MQPARIGSAVRMSEKLVPTSESVIGPTAAIRIDCADRARRRRFPQQDADEKIDQQQIEAVHRADDHQAVGQRQQMAQIIDREIDGRIEIGLEAGRQRIEAIAAVDDGPDIVLVVVQPIPVDVFTDKPGVDRAGQERAERDGHRHQDVGLKNRRLPGPVRGPSCIRYRQRQRRVSRLFPVCRPGDLELGTIDTSRMPALRIRECFAMHRYVPDRSQIAR